MNRSFSFGREGEAAWNRLVAAWRLERRMGVMVVTSPLSGHLDEARQRLESLAPEVGRLPPSKTLPDDIAEIAAGHPKGGPLPVVWVEAMVAGDLLGLWQDALLVLNRARDTLGRKGPMFLVLAGPPALKDLVWEVSPDLASVSRPAAELGSMREPLMDPTSP